MYNTSYLISRIRRILSETIIDKFYDMFNVPYVISTVNSACDTRKVQEFWSTYLRRKKIHKRWLVLITCISNHNLNKIIKIWTWTIYFLHVQWIDKDKLHEFTQKVIFYYQILLSYFIHLWSVHIFSDIASRGDTL